MKVSKNNESIDDLALRIFEGQFLAHEELRKRTLAENSLYEFAKQAWHIIEGGHPFVEGWHLEALCKHLECVYFGKIKKLIINVPPRTSKSTIVSSMFPAWVWIQDASKQMLNASHSIDLSENNILKCRDIISSDWYRARWGHLYSLSGDQNTKRKFKNDRTGYYIAVTIFGRSVTGKGGDIKICDDPNDASTTDSDVMLTRTNRWLSSAWATRYNDPKNFSDILVQQRIATNDATGHMIEHDQENEWVKLILPMRFVENRRASTIVLPGTNKVWTDPRTKEGELLWPKHIPEKELKSIESKLRSTGGEYRVSGQMQQMPFADNSGILKRSKFVWWKKEKPPTVDLIITSWDTALEKNEMAAYSASTTWGVFTTDEGTPALIFLSMWRGRLEFPELKKLVIDLQADYRNDGTVEIKPDKRFKSDLILIESKASGSPLIQSLKRAGVNAIGFNPPPNKDKVGRARVASAFMESGQIYVPAIAPNYLILRKKAADFVSICDMFPMAETKDVVDTFSQIVLYLSRTGHLSNKYDPKPEKNKKNNKGTYKFYETV